MGSADPPIETQQPISYAELLADVGVTIKADNITDKNLPIGEPQCLRGFRRGLNERRIIQRTIHAAQTQPHYSSCILYHLCSIPVNGGLRL
jgi:hypothetical protein